MSLFEDTNPRPLKELLLQIHSREAVLPDFQRDFVWDPSATQELIVSIAQNYPAGSLLRIRNTQNLFACREFQGAPALKGGKSTYLVLDGQQRLTSLYQAFYGVGDHRYFVKIGDLLEGKDFEDCLFYYRCNNKTAVAYQKLELQAKYMVMPLAVLSSGAGGFSKWAMEIAQIATKDEATKDTAFQMLQRLTEEVGKRWIQTIDDYQFPVVTLSDETSAESVCTIFETLNRTGVKLSPYELLTARFWPQNINLRAMWAKALEDHPIIEDFEVDPYYVMQAIALVARKTPSCKRKDVLELTGPEVEAAWPSVIDGLARGLTLLRERCGVIISKWLPSVQLIIPLAAILAKLGNKSGPQVGAAINKVQRWYWCSVFGQTYDQAPNTQSANDLTAVLAWINGGAEPPTVATFSMDDMVLDEITPKQRALYKGLMTLILRGGPVDFHSGDKLTGELIIEQHVDDHHVFPDNYLKKLGVDATRRSSILNRTLIDRTTNQVISDRAPSDYMADIREALGSTTDFASVLESHMLPAGSESPIWTDDFDTFVNGRRSSLFEAVASATGMPNTEGDGTRRSEMMSKPTLSVA